MAKKPRSFTNNTGVGRKPKLRPGQHADHKDLGLVVAVDYERDKWTVSRYRVIRLYSYMPYHRYGRAIWVRTHHLKARDDLIDAPTSLQVYRANKKLGLAKDRGCSCNCCAHTAIPRGQIRTDGSFKWEQEDDE